jgi:hypothetical protein
MNESIRIGFFLVALGTATNCGDDSVAGAGAGAGGSGGDAGGSAATGGSSGANSAGSESGAPTPCAELLCETFDGYSGVTAIANGQVFGPWRAAVPASATGSMTLDGTRSTSGARAFHVHVDAGATG